MTDLEIGDINGDEYNDIILVGNNTGKAYYGGPNNISTYAGWEISGNIGNSPNVAIADLNKDGIKDIITLSANGMLSDFVSPYINSLNEQVNCLPPGFINDGCIKTVDINSTGGISLLYSFYWDGGTMFNYGIFGLKPIQFNPNPSPPMVYKSYENYNGNWHPKLKLYNRDERDFNHYQIWKKGPSSNDFTLYADNVTSNSFRDDNEIVVFSGEDQSTSDNCFYFAKSVDNTNQISINSNQQGFIVNVPTCDNCNSDNLINIIANKTHEKFSISNYPNPFNPTTKILYTLPNSGFVNITIYNTSGQVVKVLSNEYKNAGSYNIEFNGSNLSSGIYFYRITSGKYFEVKKMILIK